LVIIENHQGAYTTEEHEAAKKEFFEAVGMGGNGSVLRRWKWW
jgi:splicing factor 3B subunit 3